MRLNFLNNARSASIVALFATFLGGLAACGGGGSSADTTPPTITLNGAASVTVALNNRYTEQGATFADAVDGNGAVTSISGAVNTAAVGTYTVTYRKSDAAGNTGMATRRVVVADPMPIGAALADVTINDRAGVSPVSPSVDAGGATDSLARTVNYSVSGLPVGGGGLAVSGLSINISSGVISGTYDANGTEVYSVTVTATPAGSEHPLVRTFTLTILDNG